MFTSKLLCSVFLGEGYDMSHCVKQLTSSSCICRYILSLYKNYVFLPRWSAMKQTLLDSDRFQLRCLRKTQFLAPLSRSESRQHRQCSQVRLSRLDAAVDPSLLDIRCVNCWSTFFVEEGLGVHVCTRSLIA